MRCYGFHIQSIDSNEVITFVQKIFDYPNDNPCPTYSIQSRDRQFRYARWNRPLLKESYSLNFSTAIYDCALISAY